MFSPILVKFKNTIIIEEIKKSSLKEPFFSFSIQSCSLPCWMYNNYRSLHTPIIQLPHRVLCVYWLEYLLRSVFQEHLPLVYWP